MNAIPSVAGRMGLEVRSPSVESHRSMSVSTQGQPQHLPGGQQGMSSPSIATNQVIGSAPTDILMGNGIGGISDVGTSAVSSIGGDMNHLQPPYTQSQHQTTSQLSQQHNHLAHTGQSSLVPPGGTGAQSQNGNMPHHLPLSSMNGDLNRVNGVDTGNAVNSVQGMHHEKKAQPPAPHPPGQAPRDPLNSVSSNPTTSALLPSGNTSSTAPNVTNMGLLPSGSQVSPVGLPASTQTSTFTSASQHPTSSTGQHSKLNPTVTRVTNVPLNQAGKLIPVLTDDEIRDIKAWMRMDKEHEELYGETLRRARREISEATSKLRWWERDDSVKAEERRKRLAAQEGPKSASDVFKLPRLPGNVGPQYQGRERRRGSKREGFRLPGRLKNGDVNRPEQLVPIRLEFDVEHHKFKDTFVWNLNGTVSISLQIGS